MLEIHLSTQKWPSGILLECIHMGPKSGGTETGEKKKVGSNPALD